MADQMAGVDKAAVTIRRHTMANRPASVGVLVKRVGGPLVSRSTPV